MDNNVKESLYEYFNKKDVMVEVIDTIYNKKVPLWRRKKILANLKNKFSKYDLVITDSFHACVFSIIFHKDFYAICNPKRGNDRFISLLEMFGLTDRLFNSLDEINVLKLKSIDYESVERKLKEKRQMSLSLLRTSLTMDNDSNNR